ncbi:MAG TPA: hypothetical protein VNT75_09425 [Symbiobacteriaceae bacterium]|nr:hypothetical protein [Symbiobacteriaceae bacterium]
MGRYSATAWVTGVLLALAVAAGCGKGAATEQKSDPKPAVAEAGLTLRVPEGEKATYHATIRTAFSGRSLNGQALPVSMPLTGKTQMEYDADLHFEKVTGTEATVNYTLSGIKVETEVGGTALPVTTAPGDMRFTMKLDTVTRKLLDFTLGPEYAGVLDKEHLMPTLEKMFVQWPQGASPKPGDSWTVETPLPLDLQTIRGESKISVTTTYESNETRNGVQVAKLVSTGSGPITLSGDTNGVIFTVKGTIELTGVQYIDLKTGLPQSVESRSTFKFTQSMKEQKSGLALDTEMESTSEMSMVRK